MEKQTVSAHPTAHGMVAVYEGDEMILSIWAWSVKSCSVNPKAKGVQIGLKDGTWFGAFVTVGEFTTAQAGAMNAYNVVEHGLRFGTGVEAA